MGKRFKKKPRLRKKHFFKKHRKGNRLVKKIKRIANAEIHKVTELKSKAWSITETLTPAAGLNHKMLWRVIDLRVLRAGETNVIPA